MASGSVESYNDLFMKKSYSYVYSVSSGGTLQIKADDFNISTPSGYIPICVSRVTSGSSHVAITNLYVLATGTGTIMTIREVSGTDASDITARLEIVYVKSGFGV